MRTDDRVVLTYDDGPEPIGTEAVLSALADAGATATFFVLMTRVRRFGSLFDEVLAGGHEIGLHGIDHRPLPAFTAREVKRRCAEGRAELEDRIGAEVRWLRPPYGRLRLSSWAAVRAAGLTPVLWGPSTADSVAASIPERAARACDGVKAGAILLAHDGFAGPDDGVDDGPPPQFDRGALATEVVSRYRALGLRPGTLADAAGAGRLRRSAIFTG